jgi:hypothetical protein
MERLSGLIPVAGFAPNAKESSPPTCSCALSARRRMIVNQTINHLNHQAYQNLPAHDKVILDRILKRFKLPGVGRDTAIEILAAVGRLLADPNHRRVVADYLEAVDVEVL